MRREKKSPRGLWRHVGGGNRSLQDHTRSGRRHQFVPPRFARTLPPLDDSKDVELAVHLRGAIRRAINRGQPDVAARFAVIAADLVGRRAAP